MLKTNKDNQTYIEYLGYEIYYLPNEEVDGYGSGTSILSIFYCDEYATSVENLNEAKLYIELCYEKYNKGLIQGV